MLARLHSKRKLQLVLAYLLGIFFGFLLQKGGASRYAVVAEQLLLKDFTVVKIMLSAVIVGMAGIYAMMIGNHVRLHPKHGSLGSIIPGGIVFGAGFALLGYCPGTLAAAAGQGNLDAALAGIPGMLAGTWIYALIYPRLNRRVLHLGTFGDGSLPIHLKIPAAAAVPLVIALLATVLFLLEQAGY